MKTVHWNLNQTSYLDNLAETFGPSTTVNGYIPEVLSIRISIISFDPTNYDGRIYDNFTLEIHSNGESASATCNFDSTIITNSLDGVEYTYNIETSGDSTINNIASAIADYSGVDTAAYYESGATAQEFWIETGYTDPQG